jgi:hypothetical protein
VLRRRVRTKRRAVARISGTHTMWMATLVWDDQLVYCLTKRPPKCAAKRWAYRVMVVGSILNGPV